MPFLHEALQLISNTNYIIIDNTCDIVYMRNLKTYNAYETILPNLHYTI